MNKKETIVKALNDLSKNQTVYRDRGVRVLTDSYYDKNFKNGRYYIQYVYNRYIEKKQKYDKKGMICTTEFDFNTEADYYLSPIKLAIQAHEGTFNPFDEFFVVVEGLDDDEIRSSDNVVDLMDADEFAYYIIADDDLCNSFIDMWQAFCEVDKNDN